MLFRPITDGQFNGAQSTRFSTPAGVPQGSPLSPILYIFYNADLLDIPHPGELALGFIDDIGYGVKGRTALESTTNLKYMLAKAEQWRKTHGAQFEKSKYVLIHFTRSKSINTEATITIDGTTIAPTAEARYLHRSDIRPSIEIQNSHKPGGKERHPIWASNRTNSESNVGFRIQVPKKTFHGSHRTSNGLCSSNMAPPGRQVCPHNPAT
jgi:hypothetical protein